MRTSEQTDKIAPAFVEAQAATDAAMKDNTNPAFKSKYADLASHVGVIKPAAKAHKLAVVQELTSDDAGVQVTTRVIHASGQWFEFGPLHIPANKHDAQGFGSAASYARRYALSAAWGTVADDDDGNAAVASKPVSVPEPVGFKDWLADMTAMSETADVDTMRDSYKSSAAKYRHYLETTQKATLDKLVDRARQNAPLPVL
jgi:hypothetical protein